MKRLRKICCLMLSICLSFSFGVSAEDKNVLTGLNLADKESYVSTDNMTRIEFARIICALSPQTKNTDTADDEAVIKAVTSAGLMSTYSDSEFEETYNVSKEEISYAYVKILGYEEYAKVHGGYPNGYVYMADSLKLFPAGTGKYPTKEQISYSIEKLLNTDMLEIGEISKDSVEYEAKKGKTVLTEILNGDKIKGIVNGNEYTAFSGEAADKGYILIDGEPYYYPNGDKYEFLGCRVEVYYIENDADQNEIIYIYNKDSSKVELAAADIDKADSSKYVMKSDDKDIKYSLDKSAVFIYNGKVCGNIGNNELIPKSGKVVLTDNNNDETYDVVFIYNGKDAAVESVNLNNGEKITDKDFNVYDLESVKYCFYGTDEIKSVSDLKDWDILSIYISKDGKLYTIYACRDTVTGQVTAVNDDSVEINGEEYETDIVSALNDTGYFYLNYLGRIVKYKYDASFGSYSYGFLYSAGTASGIGAPLELEIFTSTGEWVIFKAAEKIKINGKNYSNSDENAASKLKSNDSFKQLVRYSANADNEITEIATKDYPTLLKRNTKEAEYDDGLWITAINMFSGLCFADSNTVVFKIPASNMDNKKGYSVLTNGSFANSGSYNIDIYNMDDNYTAQALVYHAGSASAEYAQYIMVDKITDVYYEEENKKMLIGYAGPTKVQYVCDDEEMLANIDSGDIINYAVDGMGLLCAVSKVVDADKTSDTFISNSDGTMGYHALKRRAFGVITSKNGTRIKAAILNEDGTINEQYNEIYEMNGVKPVIYNKTTGKFTIGDSSSYTQYLFANSPDSRILIHTAYSSVMTAYIYE